MKDDDVMSYKPYAKYKPSGVEWIGEIPEGWTRSPIKYAAMVNPPQSLTANGLDGENVVTFLPMERVGADGSISIEEKRTYEEVKNGFTCFAEKDVILAKITPCFENGKGAYLGNLGSSVGFGSTEFHVLRGQDDKSDPKFLYYVTNSAQFRKVGEAFMTGAAGQKRVSTEFLASYILGIPPVSEQTQIATFLDRKTTQIDKLIEIKRKQIELLKEERTAIINQAVTKGLNPDAKMKESGIEWIGEIPEGWDFKKIKYLIKLSSGGTPPTDKRHYWKNEVPWVSSKDMKKEVITDAQDYISETAIVDGKSSLLPNGSGLLVVRSGILQHTIPVAVCNRDVAFNQDIKGLIPNTELLDINYFAWFVRGNQSNLLKEWRKQGATVESLETEFLQNFKLPLPLLEDQKMIVDVIREMSQKVDQTIEKDLKQIHLLKEYRTTLISDAVTGKIDIREEAA